MRLRKFQRKNKLDMLVIVWRQWLLGRDTIAEFVVLMEDNQLKKVSILIDRNKDESLHFEDFLY